MEDINQEKVVKELIIEHNKCRQDPKAYAKILETYLTYFTDEFCYKLPNSDISIKTTEGKKAYQECINFLLKQESIGILELCEGLCKSSEDHVKDMGPKGLIGHIGSDNSNPQQRIERHIKWGVTCSENLTFGPKSSQDIIVGLIVDDAVPDRGHRKNVFNPALKYMGSYLDVHKDIRYMCAMNYAGEIIEDSQKGKYFQTDNIEIIPTITNNLNCSVTTKTEKKRKKLSDIEKKVKKEDFFAKMKKIRETGKMLFDEQDYKKFDEHIPSDAVSVTIKKISSIENGRLTKRIYKTYIRLDGTKHVVEYEDKS